MACAARAQTSITMWQADLQHTGQNLNETTLNPGSISSPGNFGLLFTQQTDGQTYGQALIAAGVSINGTTHNVIYVGTQHDSLYAFDADSNTGANASPLWHASFIQAGVTQPIPQTAVNSSDITDECGITTTPVIDPSSSTIYIVSAVQNISDSSFHQYLHALDLATGAEKFNGPIEINPTFAGSANYNKTEQTTPGVIPFNPLREHLRCAMTLSNGIVYLCYASHSDTQPYHGEILGYGASNLQLMKSFISTPNSSGEGGFWAGGAGPAFDSSGNMFIATGNGAFDQTVSPYTSGTDWGETMLKLPPTGAFTVSASNSTLNWFTPNNWNNLNGGDLDLGSSGLLLLPDQTGGSHTHLLVGGGKGGVLYVVDRDNMGGISTPDSAVQELTTPNNNYLFATPAYFNGNIYYASSGGPLEQRTVGYDPTTGNYISAASVQSTATFNNKGASCFISANGATGGVVWVLTGSGLQAYDATNVSEPPLTSVNATTENNVNCQNTKFSLPVVANGKAYFTGFVENGNGTNRSTGYLFVCGVFPAAAGTPAAASNAAAAAVSSSQVNVTWTDNSNNESGFIVRRATSPSGPFTQTGSTVAANVTTFTDTGLSPDTTYYYQVFAENANGDANASNVASVTTFPLYSANGLVAYWNLDESPTSGTANDATGNGHTGTVNGEAVFAAGYINDGIDLHGTGFATSNISVPNTPALQFGAAQSFTLSAWVDPENVDGKEQAIIAKSADQGNEYGIWINASNQWVFRGPAGDLIGPTATTSTWTHVAVVQDGAAGTRKLYINGALQATAGTAQAADGAGALWMGQQNVSGTPDSFPGIIDEVRLYNRALPATEITTLLGPPILDGLSLQTQGTAGTFGVTIAPLLAQTNEPRKGAPVGTYTLQLTFSAPVSGITATLGLQGSGTAVGSVSSVSYDSSGRIVTVVLKSVGNDQALDLHLTGITPGSGTADVPFNVLWGDVDSDNAVSYLDAALVQNNETPVVNSSNSVYDINCDGAVAAADVSLVNSAIGTQLGTETDTNMALYQAASDLTSLAPNTAPMAFDNSVNTRWESIHGVDPQWLEVDLGSVSAIHSIVLDWENAAGASYYLQSSTDDVNWTNLLPEITGNTATGVLTYPGLNGSGRYVRMYGLTRTTTYGYSLLEFQVNGIPGSLTANPAPSLTGDLSASGTSGSSFSYQVTATNSPTSYAATSLPPGLGISSSTGLISGTPTSGGTYNASVTATNGSGKSAATPVVFTIAGGSSSIPSITSATSASGTVGTTFSYQITATNSPASYNATGLPAGLSVNTSTGLISGTPTTAGGPTTVSLSATNSTGTGTGSVAVTISAAASNPPSITSATTVSGTVGTAFSYQITATNSPASYNATGLPAGLSVNTSTGLISGTPTAAGGPTTVSLSATNGGGTGTGSVAITISAATNPPSITSATTASGTVGTAFSYQITATNSPTSYNATGLPAGLSVNTSTGLISGTPTTASGPTTVSLSATNGTGTGTGSVAVTISAATNPPVINSASTAAGTVGTAFSYQISATNSPTSFNATGLPAGLSVNKSTGLISGTPTTAGGPTTVNLSATNGAGTGTGSVAITIDSASTDVLLSQGQPAAASSVNGGNIAAYAFDGDGGTRWESEQGVDPQWVYVDLNGIDTIHSITLNWENAAGQDYLLQVSNDLTNWTTLVTVTGNTASGVLNYTGLNGTGRYVRMYGTTRTTIYGYSLWEFQVYGVAGTPIDSNVALNKAASATSFTSPNSPNLAFDGDTTTRWESLYSDPQSIQVNLGAIYNIDTIVLNWQNAAGEDYTLQVSNDGNTWTTVQTVTGNTSSGVISYPGLAATGQYVKMSGTTRDTTYGYSLMEFQVLGYASAGALPAVTSSKTATGAVNTAFSYQIVATHNPTSYNATSLPAGLSVNTTSGVISGTPTTPGTTTATISATNTAGTGTSALKITIDGTGKPVINSAKTATGMVGNPFSYQIKASHTPTSYKATNLPAGLSVNTTSGLISGTPTAARTTKVSLSATNAKGTGTATLSLTIDAAADTNVALNQTPTAKSSRSGYPPSSANDGKAGTRWAASAATFPQWWMVDLGAGKTLSNVTVDWYNASTTYYQYHIDVSTDGSTFTTMADKTANTTMGNTSDSFSATARYVRVTITKASAERASAYEIEVYGH